MLILTRMDGEAIRIGDDITIEVLSVDGATVKIGIDAPREVIVLRGELAGDTPAASDSGRAPLSV